MEYLPKLNVSGVSLLHHSVFICLDCLSVITHCIVVRAKHSFVF